MIALNNGITICFIENEKLWKVSVKGKEIFLDNKSNLQKEIFLLPVLENERNEVIIALETELISKNLPIDFISSFPFKGIIELALNSQSNYWIQRGLFWLSENEEWAYDSLQKITQDKRINQRLRHSALKYINKIK